MSRKKSFSIDIILCILAVACIPTFAKLTGSRKLSTEDEELRYLTFGTSLTWGSTLKDRYQAFPYLLSPNTKNVAMRASDSTYPSMCTQSMVGDDIYDVIIIEYDRRRFEYTVNLSRRLRQRFPDATIILTKMWNLQDILVALKDDKSFKKLRDYLTQSGKPALSDDALNYVLHLNPQMTWEKNINIREKYYKQAEEEYGVKIYDWPTQGVLGSIVKSRFNFFEDYVHFNEYGHRAVAKEISTIVAEAKAKRSDKVGSWGEGDVCYSWFHDGEVVNHENKLMRFNNNIVMNHFTSGKYALEFTKDRSIFHVNNPFSGSRNLYLTYMASYPNRLYPKVRVRCGNSEPTIIDPIAKYDFPVHVQDTKIVCQVGPGKNIIKIENIQDETNDSLVNFRMVGIAITNENFNPSNMYFRPLED